MNSRDHIFIDFKKAFDRVRHAALWATMKKYNISTNLIQVIKNLYNNDTPKETDKQRHGQAREQAGAGAGAGGGMKDTHTEKDRDRRGGDHETGTERQRDRDREIDWHAEMHRQTDRHIYRHASA